MWRRELDILQFAAAGALKPGLMGSATVSSPTPTRTRNAGTSMMPLTVWQGAFPGLPTVTFTATGSRVMRGTSLPETQLMNAQAVLETWASPAPLGRAGPGDRLTDLGARALIPQPGPLDAFG